MLCALLGRDIRDFFVSSGAEFRPLSQWDLGDFFPLCEKKNPNLKKKLGSRIYHMYDMR